VFQRLYVFHLHAQRNHSLTQLALETLRDNLLSLLEAHIITLHFLIYLLLLYSRTPRLTQHVVGFNRVARNELHEHHSMDRIRGETNDQRLEFTINGGAVGLTGQQVEAWGE
jgi:hypothetical protein